jgi:hypothetical protein
MLERVTLFLEGAQGYAPGIERLVTLMGFPWGLDGRWLLALLAAGQTLLVGFEMYYLLRIWFIHESSSGMQKRQPAKTASFD